MGITDQMLQWICDYITGGVAGTAFDHTNAHIGVGDSAAAFVSNQTNLQAITNKKKNPMDEAYPSAGGPNEMIFQATFGADDANFHWQEWTIHNASTGGTMMNRKVEDNGTKVSGMVWIFRVYVTLE